MHKHFSRAFTIVELVVIIFIVGILVSVSVAGYSGWQYRSAQNTLKSDLTAVASAMQAQKSFGNAYPNSLAQLSKNFTPSPKVSLSLSLVGGGHPVYNNLSNVQNGILFYNICGELITEGYGKGVNNGGQNEQYISACNVYNNPEIQVNSAWNARNFTVPIVNTMLPELVSSINYSDSWRPGRDEAEKSFYQTWHERFTAYGGTYPVTSFWDPWANMWSGVPKETLPTPSTSSVVTPEQGYCVQSIHTDYPTEPMHINGRSVAPLDGAC